MKIFIIGSKHNYHRVEEIKKQLEMKGHIITLPVGFDDPSLEFKLNVENPEELLKIKNETLIKQRECVLKNDAVFVMNFEKHGQPNYIGGATFLEMYEAFINKKKIYLYNQIPEGILKDEIREFIPIIINGNLELIK
jgi:hypothetical protein